MASSVKSSMSQFYADIKKQSKASEKKMSTDDFYKQASQEFLKDASTENEQKVPAPQQNVLDEPKETQEAVSTPTIVEQAVIEPAPVTLPESPPVVQPEISQTQTQLAVDQANIPPVAQSNTASDDFADDFDDFDFVDHYGDDSIADNTKLLPENTARSAINCAFVGIGGGGGKMAKSFLDLGFNRTVLINTTHKDQPQGINPEHFLLLDGSDGVGKDVVVGRKILSENATLVEDMLRARLYYMTLSKDT